MYVALTHEQLRIIHKLAWMWQWEHASSTLNHNQRRNCCVLKVITTTPRSHPNSAVHCEMCAVAIFCELSLGNKWKVVHLWTVCPHSYRFLWSALACFSNGCTFTSNAWRWRFCTPELNSSCLCFKKRNNSHLCSDSEIIKKPRSGWRPVQACCFCPLTAKQSIMNEWTETMWNVRRTHNPHCIDTI